MNSKVEYYSSIVYRFGQIYWNRHLKEDGLGAGQVQILLALADQPGSSQEDLVSLLKTDKGTVSAAVKKLAEKGFLDKERDSQDRRAFKLSLTDKSHSRLPVWKTLENQWDEILTKGIDKSLLRQGEFFLENLAKQAEIYLWKERARDE